MMHGPVENAAFARAYQEDWLRTHVFRYQIPRVEEATAAPQYREDLVLVDMVTTSATTGRYKVRVSPN